MIVVCGGGNIAHSLAAIISMRQPVAVMTRRPELWGERLTYVQSGKSFESKHDIFATADVSVVSHASTIFIALPQFAIAETLESIIPFLKNGSTIIFVPALAKACEYKEALIGCGCNVVGFQRVPFISRVICYGKSVSLSEHRTLHRIAVSQESIQPELQTFLSELFGGDIQFLSSFMIFVFSNSNPLLHPARLVVLLQGGEDGHYADCPYFYAQWTDRSSELYINADKELKECFNVCDPLGVNRDYESVMDHYCVRSPHEMTKKIRSIMAFKAIKAPWILTRRGWGPDFSSRYFTEDIPFGTMVIQDCARIKGVNVPTIDYMVKEIVSYHRRCGGSVL